jgi:NAD(P)-dependent dehydrogenase (short-subunit alcohol dehydrogenase family)
MIRKFVDKKRVLVTGATRGIGSAVAERFVQEGAEVIATGSTPKGRVPAGCRFEVINFSDCEAMERFVERVADLEIDILVNNAGINKITPFSEIDIQSYEAIQSVNLHAPMKLCQAVLPYMRAQQWGRIVNISSIFGVISKAERAPYSASKFALDGMTASLAAEVASDGILANCVAPGFIDTDMTRSILGESGMKELADQVPAKRLGTPQEIASFVVWLASKENTYVSGQNLVIDGGFTRV